MKTARFALVTDDDSSFKWLFEQSKIANQIKGKMVAKFPMPSAHDLPTHVADYDNKYSSNALSSIAVEVASSYKEPEFTSATIPYRTRMLQIEKHNHDFFLLVPDMRTDLGDKHAFRIIRSKKHSKSRNQLLESYIDEKIAKSVRSLLGHEIRNKKTGEKEATEKKWDEVSGKLVFKRKRGWEFHLSYEPLLPSSYEPETVMGIDVGIRKPIVLVIRSLEDKCFRTEILRPLRRNFHKDKQVEYFRHLAQKLIIPLAIKYKALISLENLNVKDMMEKTSRLPSDERLIHRLVSRAAFKKLQKTLRETAQDTGVPTILIDPQGTSQCCPRCNPFLDIKSKKGKFYRDDAQGHPERVKCPDCGYENDADWIGAWNIAGRAMRNCGFSTNASWSKSEVSKSPPSRAFEEIRSTAVAKVEVLSMTQSATSETIENAKEKPFSHL